MFYLYLLLFCYPFEANICNIIIYQCCFMLFCDLVFVQQLFDDRFQCGDVTFYCIP